jgi:transposase
MLNLFLTPQQFKNGKKHLKCTICPRYHLPSLQRMVQAAAQERTFSRRSVEVSAVANVIVEKYVDHLPLERQGKVTRVKVLYCLLIL